MDASLNKRINRRLTQVEVIDFMALDIHAYALT